MAFLAPAVPRASAIRSVALYAANGCGRVAATAGSSSAVNSATAESSRGFSKASSFLGNGSVGVREFLGAGTARTYTSSKVRVTTDADADSVPAATEAKFREKERLRAPSEAGSGSANKMPKKNTLSDKAVAGAEREDRVASSASSTRQNSNDASAALSQPPKPARSKKGLRVRADLGAGDLIREWRPLLASAKDLKNDAQAGVITACVSVPLSLAIAVGSGMRPEVGLVTAVVGAFVAAVAGGTPLAVSGPAAAIVATCFVCAEKFGATGVVLVAGICGALQVLSGALSLGAVGRMVPLPVVAGFTSGIGLTVFFQQLPVALSLPKPESSHPVDVITHVAENLAAIDGTSAALAAGTVAAILLLPKVPALSKLPSTLVAVTGASAVAAAAHLPVPRIGTIPSSLPAPSLPDLGAIDPAAFPELLSIALVVFGIASVESLLSSSAVDKLSKGRARRHDPNQELIGQGLANLAASAFGGMPVSSVIVRSSLNIHSGAVTRRSGVLQSCALVGIIYTLSPYMSEIPMPVLSAVLLSVALRMLSPYEIKEIWAANRVEAIPWAMTVALVSGVDVIAGVAAGAASTLVIKAVRGKYGPLAVTAAFDVELGSLPCLAATTPVPAAPAAAAPAGAAGVFAKGTVASVRTAVAAARRTAPDNAAPAAPAAAPEGARPRPVTPRLTVADRCDYVQLAGVGTFMSSVALSDMVEETLATLPDAADVENPAWQRPILFDLAQLTALDISGAELIIDAVGTLIEQGKPCVLVGARDDIRAFLLACDHGHRVHGVRHVATVDELRADMVQDAATIDDMLIDAGGFVIQ